MRQQTLDYPYRQPQHQEYDGAEDNLQQERGQAGRPVTIRERWQTPVQLTCAQGNECSHSTHYTWVTLWEDAFLGQLLLSL